MLKEIFDGYTLIANPVKTQSGKWSVSVIIERSIEDDKISKTYYANDNIAYILEIEAAKECINLGKNLIKSNMI